ncbi:MAG TPA: ATP-binding protein [Candidatus Acidoferrales bacterium]|nr:ATP-binding protein [Candidatus Acidoferrales bacterium]
MSISVKHQSIGTKLTRVIVATCGAAVLAACAVFAMYDIHAARAARLQALKTITEITGTNSTAALAFHDSKAGEKILQSLSSERNIQHALLYTPDGKVLTEYDLNGNRAGFSPPESEPDGVRLTRHDIRAFFTIHFDGKPLGRIYVDSDIAALRTREEGLAAMVGLCLLIALIVAQLLGSRLQRVISAPILQLAQTAFTVAVEKNYSVRATGRSGDEIGFLYEQFNAMLDGIQKRDGELERVRSELEQRVAERTAYLNALIETSPLGIVTTDRDGKVRMCNNAFERLFQYSRSEIIDAELNGLVAPPELIDEVANYTRRIVAGEPIRVTTRRRRKDGSLLDVEMYGVPLYVSGEQAGELVLYHDMSEQKRAELALHAAKEMAESANKAKSDFLANMSHEIRTPMNGIIGMTQLALESNLHPKVREYLTLVRSSADSLLVLLNDILDFSKIEAGKFECESLPFALRENLNPMLKPLEYSARRKGLEFEWHISPGVPECLIGDWGRLRQILVNLVGNAIKFTERGEVAVSVELARSSATWAELLFTIRDTGIGIAEDKQSSIFAAFTQGDASTTRRYGGTGLGLAIAQRLVNMMNGNLTIQSKLGEGSSFRFTARFGVNESKSASSAVAQPPTPDGPSAPALMNQTVVFAPRTIGPLRILLAEDNVVNRQLAIKLLERQGHVVTTACDGREALTALERENFDLVLMDVQMPNVDGLEAIRIIRGKEKLSGEHLPIISVTAHVMKGDRETCLAAGADSYIAKPLHSTELFRAIEDCCSHGVSGSVPAPKSIDELEILERCQGNRKLLAEIIELFGAGSTELLQEMDSAVTRGDAAALAKAAHTLKGSIGNFSSGPAYVAVQMLEACAQNNDLALARKSLPSLSVAVQQLTEELEPFRNRAPATGEPVDVRSGKS